MNVKALRSALRLPYVPPRRNLCGRCLLNPSRDYIGAFARKRTAYRTAQCALLNFQLMQLDSAAVKASRDVFHIAGVCIVSTCVAEPSLNGFSTWP